MSLSFNYILTSFEILKKMVFSKNMLYCYCAEASVSTLYVYRVIN